jgi:hypothetical protein
MRWVQAISREGLMGASLIWNPQRLYARRLSGEDIVRAFGRPEEAGRNVLPPPKDWRSNNTVGPYPLWA